MAVNGGFGYKIINNLVTYLADLFVKYIKTSDHYVVDLKLI